MKIPEIMLRAKDIVVDPEDGAVFRAVAKCPLQMDENRIWFDADEFFRIVLQECDPEGTA